MLMSMFEHTKNHATLYDKRVLKAKKKKNGKWTLIEV